MQTFQQRLFSKINKFTSDEEKVFDRIYKVWFVKGASKAPQEMHEWLIKKFGSVEAIESQKFLKITNIVTYEGAIFNELRTKRPILEDQKISEVMELIESTQDANFFKPLIGTPADTFGRIKGKYCVTAANLTKYDGMHALIIFDDPNPLLFSRKRLVDYFDVAKKWFQAANKENKRAIYPMFTWNCLWRAGASIVNGHSQLVLTEGQAYAKVEELRRLTSSYQETHKSSYFDDIYSIHKSLGLGFSKGKIKIIAKLTPIKEKETMITAPDFDQALAETVSDTLNAMKERLGVRSFNLSIILPPLEETRENWSHMPVVVRVVDRGRLSSRTTDIGVMELYAQSVIGSNPYVVVDALKGALIEKKGK